MPICGSQVLICDLPIRFDTYSGCSHGCKYCFTQNKINLNNIKRAETKGALKSFISGFRTKDNSWCDWGIPLHWGGMSDPFQPIESVEKNSLECLKLFSETGYPFIVSTKGRLVAESPYLELFKSCKCIIQISMACSSYDVMEPGAPKFMERLQMAEKLSGTGKRVIVRLQPYLTSVKNEVINNLKAIREAGVYGITIEGMKRKKKYPGTVRLGGDHVYPKGILRRDFAEIREAAKAVGLKFYCAENRLRDMGDSLCCCGVNDGEEGFETNKANMNHFINDKSGFSYTEKMKTDNTGSWASHGFAQSARGWRTLSALSYERIMEVMLKDKKYLKQMSG